MRGIAPLQRYLNIMLQVRKHTTTGSILFAILLFLGTSTPLCANRLVHRWFDKLEKAEEHLQNGEWDKAYWEGQEVSREALRQATGGTGVTKFLARILVIQAIAEAGRGNDLLAFWNWNSALELYPRMEELAMGSYQDEAHRLLLWLRACGGPKKDATNAPDAIPSSELTRTIGDDVIPPRKLSSPKPEYPRGRCSHRDFLILRMVINKQGRVMQPRVLKGLEEPLLVFSALMTLREWTFEPATVAGEPVDVYYNLTVNFTPFWDAVRERGRTRKRKQR